MIQLGLAPLGTGLFSGTPTQRGATSCNRLFNKLQQAATIHEFRCGFNHVSVVKTVGEAFENIQNQSLREDDTDITDIVDSRRVRTCHGMSWNVMWLTRNCGAPVQIVKCSRMLKPSRGRSQGLDPLELIDVFRTCSELVRHSSRLFQNRKWWQLVFFEDCKLGLVRSAETRKPSHWNFSWGPNGTTRQWQTTHGGWIVETGRDSDIGWCPLQTPPQSLLRNVIFVHEIPLSFDVRFQCEPRGQKKDTKYHLSV